MKRNPNVILLASLLLVSCSQPTAYTVVPPRVVTEQASSAVVLSSKSYVGTIEEDEAVSVSFTGMGTLKRVLVSEGQTVSEGQLLAEIDDTQARNMLEIAQTSYDQASDAIGRYKQLYDKGSLAEAKWIEAKSKLDEAEVTLNGAKKNLEDRSLHSPISGVIGVKHLSAGSTVLPSQSVLTIYKIKNVKVKVSIPENEIADIRSNTASTIRVASAGLSLQGGAIDKGLVADPLTHTYNIRIHLENPDMKLLPGMVCNVELGETSEEPSQQACITLPVRCIQQAADGKHFVWVVDSANQAHRSDVTLGNVICNRIEVLGIAEGSRVIVSGYQKVSEGSSVNY